MSLEQVETIEIAVVAASFKDGKVGVVVIFNDPRGAATDHLSALTVSVPRKVSSRIEVNAFLSEERIDQGCLVVIIIDDSCNIFHSRKPRKLLYRRPTQPILGESVGSRKSIAS